MQWVSLINTGEKILPPPRVVARRMAWHDTRRGENFWTLFFFRQVPGIFDQLYVSIVSFTGPTWSNPVCHWSQHHVNQTFSLGNSVSKTRSDFVRSSSKLTCHVLSVFRGQITEPKHSSPTWKFTNSLNLIKPSRFRLHDDVIHISPSTTLVGFTKSDWVPTRWRSERPKSLISSPIVQYMIEKQHFTCNHCVFSWIIGLCHSNMLLLISFDTWDQVDVGYHRSYIMSVFVLY